MTIKGLFYIEAFVSNLEKSKTFYGETLGWKLNTDLPAVAGFYFGTGYLVIVADDRPLSSRQYAGGMYVEVQVEDAASEHTRLKEQGVNVSELTDKPWGERKFTFSDPDGYTWAYGQQL
jgi:catechol 2,3-dioxygenase-like lactoylglutathione lyase family enzyme